MKFKLKKTLAAAVCIAAAAATGCSSADNGAATDARDTESARTTLESGTIEPVQAQALSSEKQGYGQGVQLDGENRPLGALDFNAQYAKYNATAIDEESDKILLTFDQGYENGLTAQILDTLKEKNVKAVFFLLKDYAVRNPELVQRMIDEGHTLGNHSVNHYSMPDLTAEECAEEITGMRDYVKKNFGVEMTLFRPPMGEFSEQSLAATQECGSKTVLWSFAYADWDTENQPDPDEAREKLINAAHKGAIYLLHSVSQTNADVLGDVIDGIRANGYEFY